MIRKRETLPYRNASLSHWMRQNASAYSFTARFRAAPGANLTDFLVGTSTDSRVAGFMAA